jgi:UDP-N-acetylmuramoyl-tripeptide--D-alanyl-D-alanine ligase
VTTPMNLKLSRIAAWLPQAKLFGNPDTPVQRVHTDTRSLRAGDLFVALKGENFDANEFIAQAVHSGAAAVIAERDLSGFDCAGLQVADAKSALGQLAHAWRMQFDLPVIAVAGSNGKTTVTQMIASILRAAHGDAAWATQGNFNNDIGVPLMLLGLRRHHRAAVFELGMNHPGEIAGLAHMCAPQVALVNNAQREHQEFMASVQAVARENATVFDHLSATGTAVFPNGDTYTALWQELAGSKTTRSFDLSRTQAIWQNAGHWQVSAQLEERTRIQFNLHVPGEHNLRNALAAATCAHAAGVASSHIEQGLTAFQPVQGRSRSVPLIFNGKPFLLLDDAYNANPDSVRAGIDVAASLPGRFALVLGDMGEVGKLGPEFHREVLAYANDKGLQDVFLLGNAMNEAKSAHPSAKHFTDMESLLRDLDDQRHRFDGALIKGSNSMKMARAVAHLESAMHTAQTTGGAHAA